MRMKDKLFAPRCAIVKAGLDITNAIVGLQYSHLAAEPLNLHRGVAGRHGAGAHADGGRGPSICWLSVKADAVMQSLATARTSRGGGQPRHKEDQTWGQALRVGTDTSASEPSSRRRAAQPISSQLCQGLVAAAVSSSNIHVWPCIWISTSPFG